MLSWDEVMALLYDAGYEGRRTDCAILRGMLEYMGSPEKQLRFVHVAGTNGKGSASRMMQEILTRAGYRTGLFISPHLTCMNERWTIDGEMISDEDLREAALRTRRAVARFNEDLAMQQADRWSPGCAGSIHAVSAGAEAPAEIPAAEKPVSFALLTLMAFDYFARKDCDIVVLEVGIGGRLDSTNVIPVPDLALIMNIGLEHTELLGNTLEEIAYEKGGIIKPGGHVVLYHQSREVEAVIRELCRERGAELIVTRPQDLMWRDESGLRTASPGKKPFPSGPTQPVPDASADREEQGLPEDEIIYTYHGHKDLRLNLAGLYQRWNMLAVLDGVNVLREQGWTIPGRAVREGLASVTWPGRFEILSKDPLVIVDGAHNPNGVEALIRNIEDPLGPTAGKRILFVVGIMADKDVPQMLRLLAPYAAGFIMETAPDGRAESAEDLCAEAARYYAGPVCAAPSMDAALSMALQQADDETAVVCCGSLYQVSAIRGYFGCEQR